MTNRSFAARIAKPPAMPEPQLSVRSTKACDLAERERTFEACEIQQTGREQAAS